MLRKVALLSLALVMVLGLVTAASAAPNLANTSQKGSLLVFPHLSSTTGSFNTETLIFIGNDQSQGVYVKCYWMDENQTVEDFHFFVTANQPIVFSTGENNYGPTFGPNRSGSLTCWAQNDEDTAPKVWNHLYGYAMISVQSYHVFYNAYAFAVRGAPFFEYADAAQTNYKLNLDGIGYDACPKYLIASFIPQGASGPGNFTRQPHLTLWPCKQDLRQDRFPTCTKAKFDVWNWNEVKFTGAYQCFKCFYEGFLAETGHKTGNGQDVYSRGPGYGGVNFHALFLGTDNGNANTARMRVQGVKSSVCNGKTGVPSENVWCDSTENTPLLGVMLYGPGLFGYPKRFVYAQAGYTMFGAGVDATGFIRADSAEAVVEQPAR